MQILVLVGFSIMQRDSISLKLTLIRYVFIVSQQDKKLLFY